MYLSQTDKDPEVWQLDILKSSQFWLPLDLHPENSHSDVSTRTGLNRSPSTWTWAANVIAWICWLALWPRASVAPWRSRRWGWQQGWHRQYNELRGDRLKKRKHLSEFSISPCKLDFWQIWRTLSYFQSGLTLIPQTSTMKYCSVFYDKFWSGHNDSVRGLPLRESCWCWWVKCSDFPGRNSANQLGCINPCALLITVQDEELSKIPKCFFDSSRWREEVHHGRDSAERRHQCLSVTWLKKQVARRVAHMFEGIESKRVKWLSKVDKAPRSLEIDISLHHYWYCNLWYFW